MVITYIGFYNRTNDASASDRVYTISAVNKMQYISNALNRAGYTVNIVSPSWVTKDSKSQKGAVTSIDSLNTLTFLDSIKFRFRGFTVLYSLFMLFFWILKHVKKGEKVLVYHSPILAFPLLLSKLFKKYEIVLEVEEIYSEVFKEWRAFKYWENLLLKRADYFICVSDGLGKRLGEKTKLIVYGAYQVFNNEHKAMDADVSLIYAGGFSRKKGVLNAIDAMQYLDSNYYLNVCGHGSEEETRGVVNAIEQINSKLNRSACIYYGLLIGDDLTAQLNKSQIALNPQDDGDYMSTAFPSKILTYLSCNLKIVSTSIPSIQSSIFSKYVSFIPNNTAEAIADAVSKIDLTIVTDSGKEIARLDAHVVATLKQLFYTQ